ncbi:MAG: hypothetical protein ACP5OV_05290 [Acidimicrobiales bacterium]
MIRTLRWAAALAAGRALRRASPAWAVVAALLVVARLLHRASRPRPSGA